MQASASENSSSQSVLIRLPNVPSVSNSSSSVVYAPNVMCFKKRFDKCWADLKIKFYHEAPLKYSELNYTKINTPQNIDFDGELSVEIMPFDLSTRPMSIIF